MPPIRPPNIEAVSLARVDTPRTSFAAPEPFASCAVVISASDGDDAEARGREDRGAGSLVEQRVRGADEAASVRTTPVTVHLRAEPCGLDLAGELERVE